MSILDGKNEVTVVEQFSQTEDTALKRFLSGSRIYIMLVVAVFSFLIFVPTFATIISIYSNANKAEEVVELSELNPFSDLTNQYVKGNTYKYVAQLGYIAETKAAATHYYYLMYLDAQDKQFAVLVQSPIEGDPTLQSIISAYLTYAKDPDAGYQGNILEITGKFKKMTANEKSLFETGLTQCAVTDTAIGYTLKLQALPTAKDTVPYYFLAVPFGALMIAGVCLYFYGAKLEKMREEANKSPYPYLNRKKK